jgi:hypothetical protein
MTEANQQRSGKGNGVEHLELVLYSQVVSVIQPENFDDQGAACAAQAKKKFRRRAQPGQFARKR